MRSEGCIRVRLHSVRKKKKKNPISMSIKGQNLCTTAQKHGLEIATREQKRERW